MEFKRPEGKPAFTAPWFKWFFPLLTLPEGHPVRWEGHLLLVTDEFFRPETTHLTCILPKGNWKTTWEAALGVWHLLTVPAPRIYCGAADLEQAKELFSFAQHFVESEPEINAVLEVKPSYREIRHRANSNNLLKVLASDDSKQGGKKQGKNSTLGLLDEEHAHENDNLRVDLTSGGSKRRYAAKIAGDPLWWTIGKDCSITTAGHDTGGPLGSKRSKFLGDPKRGIPPQGTVETGLRSRPNGAVEKHPDGRLTIARSPSGSSVLLEWACRYDPKDPENSDDLDDMSVVKFANPASTVTVEALQDAKEELSPSQFKRYKACVWTEGLESWLPETAWPSLRDPAVPVVEHRTWEGATWTGEVDENGNAVLEPTEEFQAFVASLYEPGTSVIAALDMARYRDTAAVTMVSRRPDGKRVPRTIVWRTDGHANPIRYEWPKVAILALYRTFDLQACGFDPKYADQLASELLDNHGVPMERFDQSNERIGPADTELRKEILSGEFAHDGDPILTGHVQAAASLDIGPMLLKTVQQKVANPPPIDACKALSMANALEKHADFRSMYEDEDATV